MVCAYTNSRILPRENMHRIDFNKEKKHSRIFSSYRADPLETMSILTVGCCLLYRIIAMAVYCWEFVFMERHLMKCFFGQFI